MIKQLQCLITALKAESTPLIQQLKLERDKKLDFPFFVNQESSISLIGVGVGKKHIKSRIMEYMNYIDDQNVQFINIGIAGGKRSKTKIGDLYMINQICDEKLDKKYYPDILLNHTFNECAITTVENPILSGGEKYDTLVDMESHEIFSTCSKFVPLQNIAILKIISDHMNNNESVFKENFVSKLINDKMDMILHFIHQFKSIHKMVTRRLFKDDENWIDDIIKKYLITSYQRDQLVKYIKGFRIRNNEDQLPKIEFQIPKTKVDQKKIYHLIRETLKA